jgi:hypothetical protein
MDLPHLPVLLSPEELQFASDQNVQAKGYVIAVHTQKFPLAAAPTLRFEPYRTKLLTKAPTSIKTARWSSCPCAATHRGAWASS